MKNRRGTFYASCRVENHVDRNKSAEVSKLLVDSGAEFTWINAETLKNIGVKREKKDYTFVMANGQHIAHLRAQGVKLRAEPFPTPVCRMAFISDPDGNTICIHKRNAT
jgi:predicted aspartyl protease